VSDMTTENAPDEVGLADAFGADVGSAPGGYDEPDWSGPSRDEWEDVRDSVFGLAQHFAAEQAAAAEEEATEQDDARQALLDPFADDYDPGGYIEERLAQLVGPLQAAVGQIQEEDALADAEDLALDTLDELGVPEEEQDEVLATASGLLVESALQLVLAQAGYSREQVEAAARSGDPALRQWAQQMDEWVSGGARQLVQGNRRAGLIALHQAAQIHAYEVESAGGDELGVAHRHLGMQNDVPATGTGDELALVRKFAGGRP